MHLHRQRCSYLVYQAVILNAPAWDKAHDLPLSQLLEYVHTGRAEGTLATTLDEQVKRANTEEEWKERAMGFMTMEMDQRVELRAAREEGMIEERDRFQALIAKLTSEGRLTELESVVDDPDALNTLMVENGV